MPVWPIDQSDGGCDDTPECKQGPPWPWTRQIDLIEIADQDAISDSGAEIGGLFQSERDQKCDPDGRPYKYGAYRTLFRIAEHGKAWMNVVLMRDMTDTMYDSKQSPKVNHSREPA